jgi:hypothetical protein
MAVSRGRFFPHPAIPVFPIAAIRILRFSLDADASKNEMYFSGEELP